MAKHDQLLQSAAQAVDRAKRHGADGVWASASRVRSLETHLRDGKLERVQHNTSRGLALRLYVSDRYSTHSTSDLDPTRLDAFVAEAVALTRALEPDTHRKLPDPALFAGRPTQDLGLWDAQVAEISPEARLAACEEMNSVSRGQPQVISATSIAYDSDFAAASASSNGFSDSWGATSVGLYTQVTMRDEGDAKPADGMGASSRRVGDLLAAREIGEEALRRARARLGSKKGPTVVAPMVVDRQAAGRLLHALLGPTSAGSIQQGQSFWQGKIGELAVSEKLSIVDDPLVLSGLGSRPFDGEGIAAKRMPVIERGVLRNYYVDTYYGSKLGLAPTTGSSSNQLVALGAGDLNRHVADVRSGVYVTSWLGGNSDSTTGDFSFGIRGHLIENGEIAAPVGEMNVTGNLLQLFSRLRAVGDDPWMYSSLRAPTLVFDDVQFSGA
ncbi:MAG: TldD/PmbA family protein [Myxococcales bacterium FL481]|nr:MAG: TldD/PmbA family protein [Myxococcales bacterium FL481]